MGTIISSRIQSEGLNWFGCLEIAENAIEHDILTLQSLFNKLNKNGYIPVTVFTSFKRSIDVYLVYDFAKDDTCSYRALTEFNQMLVGHGLVTSLLLHDSSRRSSNSGYRQRIENATLVVFCLTRRYVDRINDHTRTFPCQSEFHYLSSRKSFLKLLPVVFECIDEKNHDEDRDGDVSDAGNGSGIISGDLDWNNEVCEGPVAVLLGGRSTWSHLPVQLSQGTVGQTTVQLSQGTTNSPDLGQHTNTDVQSTTEEMNIVGSAGRFVAETSRPLPLHELARQGLARQVFHACVRAFVDNAHRAILLQDMTRWLREHVPAMPSSKHLPLALSFLDICDCGTMGRVARKVVDDVTLLTQAGVDKYDEEVLLAALLDEEILPTSYLIHAAEQRRKYVTTGVLLTHSELGMSPPTSPRQTLERQSKLRAKVRQTIHQKRLQRDQFLRGVYAGEGEGEWGGGGGGGGEGGEEDNTNTAKTANTLFGKARGTADSDPSPTPAPTPLGSSSSSSSKRLLPVLSPDRGHNPPHKVQIDNRNHTHKASSNTNNTNNKTSNNSNSNTNKSTTEAFLSFRPQSAGARASSGTSTVTMASSITGIVTKASSGTGAGISIRADSGTSTRASGGGLGAEEEEVAEALLSHRLHRLVGVMRREVEEEWGAKYQRAVRVLDQRLDSVHNDNRRLGFEAVDRDTLIRSLEQENSNLKAELLQWRAARGVLSRHWERGTKERRRELLAIRYEDREREKQAKEALEMPR